jgi:hypothetical protein
MKSLKGRPRRRRKDNIKIGLREIGLKGVEFIHLAQDRDRWRALVMNLRSVSVKDGEFLDQLSVLLASHEVLCSMELVFMNNNPVIYK